MSRSPWLKKSQQNGGDLRVESPSYSLTGDQFSPMPQVVFMHCTVRVDETDIDQINQRDFTVYRTESYLRESHSTTFTVVPACRKRLGFRRYSLQRILLKVQD